MKPLKLLSAFMLSGALVACGGGSPSSSSDKPDSLFPDGYVPVSSSSSSSSSGSVIVNTALPIQETFNNAVDGVGFFSSAYQALESNIADDPENSFFYPLAGLVENRIIVGDGKLTIGNARFSMGQTYFAGATEVSTAKNPKINSTQQNSVATWGELDLSKNYKISFCVVAASDNKLMQIYVDNNTTSEANSIHGGGGAGSRIFNNVVGGLVAGKRVEINIPGETTLEPGGPIAATKAALVGTATSFLQMRVESGSQVTIDDLWIGYQDDLSTEPTASTCAAGIHLEPPPPTVAPQAPAIPVLLPGDQQITVGWQSVATATSYEVLYNTIDSVDGAIAFTGNPLAGTGAVLKDLLNDTTYFVFVRAANSAGISSYSPSASATPMAPTGVDIDYTWNFNPLAYQAETNFFTAPFNAEDVNNIVISEQVKDVDGLFIFLNNGTALRYRGTDNRWNLNGHSWSGGASVMVPAVGEVAPELRAYLGFPIDSGREVTLTVNYQQSSGAPGAVSGKIVLIGSDNTVLASKDALTGSDVISYTVAEGHSLSHIKVAYSREGAGGGGVHIGSVAKVYVDGGDPNAEDRTWGFNVAAYQEANTDLFEAAFNIESADNRIKAMADVDGLAVPAVEVDGLRFYSRSAGVLRFRIAVPAWNTNGAFFTNNTTLLPAIGEDLPTNVRTYIEIPMVSGSAADVSITYVQTGSGITAGKLAFVGSDNKLLAMQDADFAGVGETLSYSLPEGHTLTHVRIIYGREGGTGGGVNITGIKRDYLN